MHKRARRGLLVAGLVLAGSLSIASAAHAAGCTSMPGHGTVCGTVHNDTGRGFHTTLQWGQAWDEPWPVRWVGPWSSLGGGNVDVDGIYVGAGCLMSGGKVTRWPWTKTISAINWGPGWHKIRTNDEVFVDVHGC